MAPLTRPQVRALRVAVEKTTVTGADRTNLDNGEIAEAVGNRLAERGLLFAWWDGVTRVYRINHDGREALRKSRVHQHNSVL